MLSTIFLPDISGFTRFVNQTAMEHSRHIIAEILELLIDANQLDFELAEIEGDALFYYKHHSVPDLTSILDQIKHMYAQFHVYLRDYQTRRICDCGACSTAIDLDLKFIVHAGDFGFIEVKDQKKPYGKDIIVAHRLLKNEVGSDEYALFSKNYMDEQNGPVEQTFGTFKPSQGSSTYGEIGKVDYTYLSLKQIKQNLPAPEELPIGTRSDNPFTAEFFINAPLPKVFESVFNLDKRLLWNKSVDGMKWDKEKINRVGTQHTCVINDKNILFETVKGDMNGGSHVLGEKTQAIPFTKEATSYFIMNKAEEGTNLRLEVHLIPKSIIGRMLTPLFGKKIRQNALETIANLKELLEEK